MKNGKKKERGKKETNDPIPCADQFECFSLFSFPFTLLTCLFCLYIGSSIMRCTQHDIVILFYIICIGGNKAYYTDTTYYY